MLFKSFKIGSLLQGFQDRLFQLQGSRDFQGRVDNATNRYIEWDLESTL